jgi:hypothetical protein
MEFVLIILAVAAVIYLLYINSKKSEERKIEKIKSDENIEKFTSEFVRIGEEYFEKGLPIIESEIRLRKNEILHVLLPDIKWMEYRKVATGGISYHGLSGRVKIAKGLNYRYGTGQFIRPTEDMLKEIDSGHLYVTNKAFFFRGRIGNKTIEFDKVISLKPATVGLVIERQTGKAVYIPFDFTNHPEYMSAIVVAWDLSKNLDKNK